MMSDEIVEKFKKGESVKSIAKNLSCSWNRVVKILSTKGYIINNTHEQILNLHEKGLAANEIADQLSLSVKTAQAYLPGIRGCIYNENISKNAENIQRMRKKRRDG